MKKEAMNHIPVLLSEVLTVLHPQPGQSYIDGTLGDGGHAAALLEKIQPGGRLLGLDQDPHQLEVARQRLESYGDAVDLVCARFSSLGEVARHRGFEAVDGIVLDLGISSRQLDSPEYGLTFADSAPLDMRLSPELSRTAADFLNHANEITIADTFFSLGDRHNSRTLARKIITYRRKKMFTVARDLKEALNVWQPSALAPIFQALRIWVNQEFEELQTVLPQAISLLKPGGILVVITFHSGEDRIVKRFLLQSRELLEVSKRIIQPEFKEIKQNSRARSAKLRWARKRSLAAIDS